MRLQKSGKSAYKTKKQMDWGMELNTYPPKGKICIDGHSNRKLNVKIRYVGYLTANLNSIATMFQSSWHNRTWKLISMIQRHDSPPAPRYYEKPKQIVGIPYGSPRRLLVGQFQLTQTVRILERHQSVPHICLFVPFIRQTSSCGWTPFLDLNRHIREARNNISILNSWGREQFYMPHSRGAQDSSSDGESSFRTVRYLDQNC